MISKSPFANSTAPPTDRFKRQRRGVFELAACRGWHGRASGVVFAGELKSFPARSQITEVACEEGWSY